MRSFAERRIGKHVKGFDASEPEYGLGVHFTDGAAFSFNTSITTCLTAFAAALRVDGVTVSEKDVTLYLAGASCITISTDCDKYGVVEAFVFQDLDGACIVENGA